MVNQHLDIRAIVLAGGLGTRLRPAIGDLIPKPLAPVNGAPFLDHVLGNLEFSGIRKVTLSVGHLAFQFVSQYQNGYGNLNVSIESEESPLGTGGAFVRCAQTTSEPLILVLNGDTLLDYPIDKMLDTLGEKCVVVSLVSIAKEDGRASKVQLDSEGYLRTFNSRTQSLQGLSYSGVTLIKKDALARVPMLRPPFSIEEGVFEKLAQDGSLAGLVTEQPFIDIGTPDSYRAIRDNR